MDPLTESEREKYDRVWKIPEYGDFSPGEGLVELAIESLQMEPGSLIDYGCGTGRAAKKFEDLGYSVIGVDISENCLKEYIPFVNSCLWELPALYSDWAFCADVMEHLPEEKVAKVFAAIAVRAKFGAFFQIATKKDGFGSRVNEVLHLTVRPPDWWEKQARMSFENVESSVKGHRVILACRN